jgi:polar amino acid transport system substrate-binding protein
MILLLAIAPAFAEVNPKAKDKKILIIGSDIQYPPYEYYDENKKITGFDVEITKLLAKEMGYEIKFEDMAFTALIPALMSGKIDAIVSAMSATPSRMKKVDFSDEYVLLGRSYSRVLVLKKKADKIKNISELNTKGNKVGVESGSFQHEYADEKIKKAKIIAYDGAAALLLALKTEKVDAVIAGEKIIETYLKEQDKEGKLVRLDEKIEMPGVAIAVKKGNTELLGEVNKAIKKVLSTKEYKRLLAKYFPNTKK